VVPSIVIPDSGNSKVNWLEKFSNVSNRESIISEGDDAKKSSPWYFNPTKTILGFSPQDISCSFSIFM
jgi:hypothetical protein